MGRDAASCGSLRPSQVCSSIYRMRAVTDLLNKEKAFKDLEATLEAVPRARGEGSSKGDFKSNGHNQKHADDGKDVYFF